MASSGSSKRRDACGGIGTGVAILINTDGYGGRCGISEMQIEINVGGALQEFSVEVTKLTARQECN